MLKKVINTIFSIASWIAALFVLLIAVVMLFQANINNFWSFIILLVTGSLLAPPLQNKINTRIGKNIHILGYFLLCFILFYVGLLVGSGTEEQIAAKKAREQQELIEKQKQDEARVAQEKLEEKQRLESERIEAAQRAKVRAEKEAEKARKQAEQERAKNTSKVMLVSKCELAVKPTLKNPSSMNVDFDASQDGLIDGKPAVHMYYYAENSFGATPRGITTCKFDDDGSLLEVVNVQ